MQIIQQGNFSYRIHGTVIYGAEDLSRAFDEMAATLERSDKARKTLVEIQIRHNTQWIREVRRRQKALALHKQRLEEKVAARTQVLESINTALRSSVRALERRTLEITQLNRLAESLQNAKDTRDAASLVVRTCQQIFPSDAGILALSDTKGHMDFIVGWGRDRPDIKNCMGEACPRKKSAGDRVSVCGAGVDGCEELCIPVNPREGKGAMMRIRLRQMADLYGRKQAARRALAGSVAGHLTACLTSLHLVDRLRREAVTDPLTGLYNRRYMEETFVRELSRMKRDNLPLSVILMDVDDFKIFNDTHGHDIGDLVLQNLAGILKKDVRTEDVACRYGGEEFLLLLPGLFAEDGLIRAETLRKRVASSPLIIEGKEPLAITLSLGIASWPDDAATSHELITAADKAMYAAKLSGRNRVCRAASVDLDSGI
ncbi:sensor domain-containing diguanylate cyclase [Desulfobotulus mexicanus]|nr:GGDEF domain-containing protein [Desulfobotulus mexicanus]